MDRHTIYLVLSPFNSLFISNLISQIFIVKILWITTKNIYIQWDYNKVIIFYWGTYMFWCWGFCTWGVNLSVIIQCLLLHVIESRYRRDKLWQFRRNVARIREKGNLLLFSEERAEILREEPVSWSTVRLTKLHVQTIVNGKKEPQWCCAHPG